jgi:hypothetical protein
LVIPSHIHSRIPIRKDTASTVSGGSGGYLSAELSKQVGMFSYSSTGIFSDTRIDAAKKLNNTYQIGTRAIGTGKMVLGAAGVVGSALTAPASCATGVGCFANAAAATISLDTGISGWRQASSGDPTETFLNQGLQSLDMSPQAASWLEAGLGMGGQQWPLPWLIR